MSVDGPGLETVRWELPDTIEQILTLNCEVIKVQHYFPLSECVAYLI